jgi:hypothetical protein
MTVIISDDNKGPVVNIAAWLGMTMIILSVFTRIGSKYSVIRKWTMDDTLIATTMVRYFWEFSKKDEPLIYR